MSELPERQKANYVEGYPLLIADSKRNNTSLSASLGLSMCVLLNNLSSGDCHSDGECAAARRALEKTARVHVPRFSRSEVLTAFEPIMRAGNVLAGCSALSFENGTAVISEDLAPYIRAIVAFDLRLEKYRLDLSGVLSRTGRKIR
jgi:sorting nexin-8